MKKKKIEDFVEGIAEAIGSAKHVDAATGIAKGKETRRAVPRTSHGDWQPAENRPDPVETLIGQGKSRVQELLPIRYARMSASPFAFYRGNALGMAIDLANTPTTGVDVQACGDAHIANFGFFGSPEGKLIFDLNDFDETFRAPWEWDVKRLAASIQICGEHRDFTPEQSEAAVRNAVRGYQETMGKFAQMGAMEVWNAHIDIDMIKEVASTLDGVDAGQVKAAKKTVKKARKKNSARAVQKLTELVDGQRRIISQPPLIVPLKDMIGARTGKQVDQLSPEIMSMITDLVLEKYVRSLRPAARMLVARYHGVDMARKVVGVGSVGTRCWIVVMQGASEDDYLVLQIKEAQKSVLEGFVGKHRRIAGGKRVVEGQQAMQLVSDPLLGYASEVIVDGVKRDFYVRQLWNSKGSIDLDTITPEGLEGLSYACGATLARAHARTGDRFQIAGYLEDGKKFSKAMAKFAQRYAQQNMADYQAFKAAIDAGKIEVASEY